MFDFDKSISLGSEGHRAKILVDLESSNEGLSESTIKIFGQILRKSQVYSLTISAEL